MFFTNTSKNFILLALVVLTISCKQQAVAPDVSSKSSHFTQEQIQKLQALGLNARDVLPDTFINPFTGDKQSGYLFEGDIFISEEQLKKILNKPVPNGVQSEQYHTHNLVQTNIYIRRNISVLGFTGNPTGLSLKFQYALAAAVSEFNALNRSFKLNLSFGANTTGYEIVVYSPQLGQAGGKAGFPSSGNPFRWVQIYAGTDSYDYSVIKHVIMHELMHCIGFRHTDWFNRSLSCNVPGIELENPLGANHIPGTGTTNHQANFDYDSVMRACFSPTETGEFSTQDQVALNYLYPFIGL